MNGKSRVNGEYVIIVEYPPSIMGRQNPECVLLSELISQRRLRYSVRGGMRIVRTRVLVKEGNSTTKCYNARHLLTVFEGHLELLVKKYSPKRGFSPDTVA